MLTVHAMRICPRSLILRDGRQRIDLYSECSSAGHVYLSVYNGDTLYIDRYPAALNSGEAQAAVYLPAPEKSFTAHFVFADKTGAVLWEAEQLWEKPREWELYIMVSAHTDIGLHNSQYIQRANSERFIDKAMELCDETEHLPPENRYHFAMEGSWFWSNYPDDRGTDAAERVVEKYIKPGKLGVFAGIAGNHTQVFGLEEMCRSTYSRRYLADRWGIDTHTMTMIDNNGMSWGMVQPWAEAGVAHIFYAPNHWNPIPSTIWKMERLHTAGGLWNPQAAGGGSRMDVRYESALPLVFWWEGADARSRMLVWCSTQYGWAGDAYGLPSYGGVPLEIMEERMAAQLPVLEKRYPYDIWLLASYQDDQEPDLHLAESIRSWNEKWAYPKLRILGNADEPFDRLKERFGEEIPVLRGDITGGWYQHPLSAANLLADKYTADRLLPCAEKLAVLASLYDKEYTYPETAFNRAWSGLVMNDEHSYGTSGYQGRRVYETWMQHRDWIEKATDTGSTECAAALQALAKHITAEEESLIVWNATAIARNEPAVYGEWETPVVTVPPFGYTAVKLKDCSPLGAVLQMCEDAPVIQNRYYRLRFSENGGIISSYDKELNREVLDTEAKWGACTFVYTKDNHNSFSVPQKAAFTVKETRHAISVTAVMNHPESGAAVIQQVTLPFYVKRIDMDCQLKHVSDMVNRNRYYRYGYYAFPFSVKKGKRYCHLNGCTAEYGKDITGHGTDVYMAANEWCAVENDNFGIGFFQADSTLVEFDHIHPDKTDFGDPGEGAALYSYVVNDWLQMHLTGGSHLDLHFRYAITSYQGNHRQAGLAAMAERFLIPLKTVSVSAQKGELPVSHSFLRLPDGVHLVNLKRAWDGNGMILRLYSENVICGTKAVQMDIPGHNGELQRNTVDEYPMEDIPTVGFITLRVTGNDLSISALRPEKAVNNLSIGDRYTGLIDQPKAFRGENAGHLYLLWGKCNDPSLSHYVLYRSTESGFTADENTKIAEIQPEAYCVGRYVDEHLAEHTTYFYRVCAVDCNGNYGIMSDEFSGTTLESIPENES